MAAILSWTQGKQQPAGDGVNSTCPLSQACGIAGHILPVNDGLVNWCIDVSHGINELMFSLNLLIKPPVSNDLA